MDFQSLIHRLYERGHRALLAVAPAYEDSSSREESTARNFSPSREIDALNVLESGSSTRLVGTRETSTGAGELSAEQSAADEFAAWLVEELGGPDR